MFFKVYMYPYVFVTLERAFHTTDEGPPLLDGAILNSCNQKTISYNKTWKEK